MAFAGTPASKQNRPFGGRAARALNLLTKAWAAEYGPSVVRVNALSPGPTRTEGTDAMGEGLEQLAARRPSAARRQRTR
jgi:NAD(P)-dependent dehydrogenase (short-subunit alcohol dehydrogenase family)